MTNAPAPKPKTWSGPPLPLLVVAIALIAWYVLTQRGSDGAGGGTSAERCQPASSALVSAIETGLTVSGGGSLSNAYIVRSDDFENAYFVAAQIEGEGMAQSVGVWSTNSPSGAGSIFAADAFAREFSDWGSGPGFSFSDDGFREARDCAASVD